MRRAALGISPSASALSRLPNSGMVTLSHSRKRQRSTARVEMPFVASACASPRQSATAPTAPCRHQHSTGARLTSLTFAAAWRRSSVCLVVCITVSPAPPGVRRCSGCAPQWRIALRPDILSTAFFPPWRLAIRGSRKCQPPEEQGSGRAIKLGSENPANFEFYHRGHGEHRGSSAILTGFEPRPPCSLCPPWLKFFPSMNPACSCPA